MAVTSTSQPSVGDAFTGAGYSGAVTANTGIGKFTVSPSPGSPVASETMTASTVFSWSGQAVGQYSSLLTRAALHLRLRGEWESGLFVKQRDRLCDTAKFCQNGHRAGPEWRRSGWSLWFTAGRNRDKFLQGDEYECFLARSCGHRLGAELYL